MIKKISKSFTLIELLVVITIIAILAGLVLPQLGKAQDSANRTASNNNIKALCSAVIAETGMSKGSYYRGFFDDRIWTITEDAWLNGFDGALGYTGELLSEAAFNAMYEPFNAGSSSFANDFVADTTVTQDIVSQMLDGTNAKLTAIAALSVAEGNDQESSSLEVFSQYNGQHPFLGFYVFDGRDYDEANVAAPYKNRGKKKLATDIRIIGETYDLTEGDELGGIGFGDGHVAVMKLGVLDSTDTFTHYATFTGNVLNARGEVTDEKLQP
jgi:prepilin-type N-terminal cleavage/methylation domain-containing protein